MLIKQSNSEEARQRADAGISRYKLPPFFITGDPHVASLLRMTLWDNGGNVYFKSQKHV